MRLRRGSEQLERLMDGSHRNLSGSCVKSSFQPSSGEAGVKEGKAVESKNRCMHQLRCLLVKSRSTGLFLLLNPPIVKKPVISGHVCSSFT